jgi:hypothetical protein
MDTVWFEDQWKTHVFWVPRERILGTIKEEGGLWKWEARVDHRYRITDQSILGKAPSLEAAKDIVESILTNLEMLEPMEITI